MDDKNINTNKLCAFLLAKVSELFAITDILYEKLKDNNIDVSDMNDSFNVRKKQEAKKLLEEFDKFISEKETK